MIGWSRMEQNNGRAAAGDVVGNFGVVAGDLLHSEIIWKRATSTTTRENNSVVPPELWPLFAGYPTLKALGYRDSLISRPT